jgi:membrane associated rhomboid family serine protease
MIGLSVLKKTTDPFFANHLWQEAKAAQPGQSGPCPVCAKPMVLIMREANALRFQICVFCEMLCFGAAEKAALPPIPAPFAGEPLSQLPPKAAEMVARLDAHRSSERGATEPSEWDWLFWLFGLPTQPGGKDWVRFPRMTVILVLATAVIGIFSPHSIDSLITIGGGNPFTTWTSRNGWNGIFYFLTLPWSDLVANLYFLVCFGANVENKVGPYPLLTIFLLPTLMNLLLSLLPGFHMGAPIAASGGVAAILVFFAFAFPQRKIFWRFGSYRTVYVVAFWLFFQIVFTAIPSSMGWPGVGNTVHLIGAFCGWVYWFFMGKKFGLDWNQEDRLFD